MFFTCLKLIDSSHTGNRSHKHWKLKWKWQIFSARNSFYCLQ